MRQHPVMQRENGHKLYKPRVGGEAEPVADALPGGDAADLEGRVGLPLDHRDVAALVVLPDRARRRRRLGHDPVRDAALRAHDLAVEHRRVELRKLERDAVRLDRARRRRRHRE